MLKNGFWVFGYGSLVWQPGFEYSQKNIARLEGFSRSFCMRSIHYRGTDDDPGLVLALDARKDAACDGVAFFVEPNAAEATIEGLRERELISKAYLEEVHPVALDTGERVNAVCYVMDCDHIQYCGGLSLEVQAGIIARAVGRKGPNTEYLFNTAAQMRQLGIEDADLNWLETRVRALTETRTDGVLTE